MLPSHNWSGQWYDPKEFDIHPSLLWGLGSSLVYYSKLINFHWSDKLIISIKKILFMVKSGLKNSKMIALYAIHNLKNNTDI